ncbi:hypothetical protein J6590_105384, partial [Homalodisca vitripennis]
LQTLKLGTYDAVITFNEGSQGRLAVLKGLGVKIAKNCAKCLSEIDRGRMIKSDIASEEKTKLARKRTRMIRKRLLDGRLYKTSTCKNSCSFVTRHLDVLHPVPKVSIDHHTQILRCSPCLDLDSIHSLENHCRYYPSGEHDNLELNDWQLESMASHPRGDLKSPVFNIFCYVFHVEHREQIV